MCARAARLVSVNVGLPQKVSWQGRTIFTGIWKDSVPGPHRVGRTNVAGDGQGDLAGHGGEQRAVFVYQLDSYEYWRGRLGRDDLTPGQFGENFTVDGLQDDEVCIGDQYRIGSALFEVTQPRVTCYRVGIRMNEPTMAALLTGHGRPGFYFRVLQTGTVQAGDRITLVASGVGGMTVKEVNALLYLDHTPDPTRLQRASQIPALSPGWHDSLAAVLEQQQHGAPDGGNAGLTTLGPTPAWLGFRGLRLVAKRAESTSILSLELEASDGAALARPLAGQFITLKLELGDAAVPVLRSYSLSGPADGVRYRITVKVEPHGIAGTYLRDIAVVGDEMQVAAPRGRFTLDESAAPIVLVSAGVGVTPLLAMLYELHDGRSSRDIWWFHGARDGGTQLFAQDCRSLLGALASAHSRVWYSRPGPDDHLGVDYDEPGHLTPEGIVAAGAPVDAEFYVCGPSPFMAGMRAGLQALGVRAGRVHTEAFGTEEPITPGVEPGPGRPPHPPAGATGTGDLVSFVRTGLTVRWDDAYTSILELAEACDVPVRWSCRTGVCHTCETGLLEGAVDYAPEPLQAPAAGNLLVCCSRPGRDVVIDL